MIEATATAPVPRPGRVWRMVLIVMAAQLVLIAVGMVLFAALGLANDGVGGCGGG